MWPIYEQIISFNYGGKILSLNPHFILTGCILMGCFFGLNILYIFCKTLGILVVY